jgi:hypothetical protein
MPIEFLLLFIYLFTFWRFNNLAGTLIRFLASVTEEPKNDCEFEQPLAYKSINLKFIFAVNTLDYNSSEKSSIDSSWEPEDKMTLSNMVASAY